MRTYLKNNFAKFQSDPIWNDAALGFLKSVPQREQAEPDEWRYGTDMELVPDAKGPRQWI